MDNSLNEVVVRDLGRYYELMIRARTEANRLLSASEQALILDARRGILHDERFLTLLPHEVEDAVALEGLDEKWGVDGEALVEKLKAMPPVALAAIVDASDWYWSGGMRDEDLAEPFRVLSAPEPGGPDSAGVNPVSPAGGA